MSDKAWNILSFSLIIPVIVSGLALVYFGGVQNGLLKTIFIVYATIACFIVIYDVVRTRTDGGVKKKVMVTFLTLFVIISYFAITRL